MNKNNGFCIDMDPVGRLVIPKEIRQKLGLVSKSKNTVEVNLVNDTLIIKRYGPTCIFCASSDNIIEFNGKFICNDCKSKINGLK